jgi:hypothetical protein
MTTSNILTVNDVNLFLKGGASLDPKALRANPFAEWMEEESFRNVLQLSFESRFYTTILDDIGRSEGEQQQWCNNSGVIVVQQWCRRFPL